MNHDHAEPIDPTAPALIVTYGAALHRRRPLDRELVLIGQARGCDLALAAPEIAEVHSAILRTAEGWFVRDCGSRIGTRINGKPIQHTRLEDGDVLQIGRFAFQAHLPDTAPPVAAAVVAKPEDDAVRAAVQADLARQAEQLRERLRACEQRERKMEEAEQDLADDIAALERETEKSLQRVAAAEQHLQRHQAEFEKELHTRRQELEQLAAVQPAPVCRVGEEPPPSTADTDASAPEVASLRAQLDEQEAELLELRARLHNGKAQTTREVELYEAELNTYRQELEQARRQLEDEAQQLQDRREEIDQVARTMELEMSRERARLAHERMDITRLREEVRQEQDRRRNDSVRERLAGLQRVKPA